MRAQPAQWILSKQPLPSYRRATMPVGITTLADQWHEPDEASVNEDFRGVMTVLAST